MTAPPIPEWGALKQKQKAQVKSRFYYIFWGVATASVVLGQVYVGSGYRQMARSFDRIMDSIVLELEQSYGKQRFY
jgi:ABC-type dipeptide/oligopeptide/nickel transport system permease subunit